MPATASSAPAADRHPLAEPIALSLVVGAMAAVMFAAHRSGHWWGDDWALYLRQAQGLIDGHPGRVLAENEFAVQMSRGPAFSPPLYPWGFPLVLAPFVAAWGPDIDRLAAVQVLAASAFSCGWYVLARRRIGAEAALLGTVAITLSPLLLGWTELIQSEWTFMAVSVWALVVLDRAAATGRLVGPAARYTTLVAIGLWTAAAFSVRREGLALVAAVAVAQVVQLAVTRPPSSLRTAAELIVPHAVALAAVAALQALLPTTVLPRYSGTSPMNMWRYRSDHVDHLLEIVGLKRPWEADPTVFDHRRLGWAVAVLFLTLAVAGIVRAALRRADVHLVAYALIAFMIGASFRVPLNRYVATVAPLLLLFAAALVTAALRSVGKGTLARVVTVTLVAAIAAGNLANASLRVGSAAEFERDGRVEWGPTHPDAVEMFDAVERFTDPDDVVAAPKARALTFATGRLAVQVDDHRPMPDLDIALVVVEPGTDLLVRLRDDRDYVEVWRNPRFRLFAPR